MDRPLVDRLSCQWHGRVAKTGRDKRWRHLSVKPPSRWDIHTRKSERPLRDDEVDRAEMEAQWCVELTVTNRSKAWPSVESRNDVSKLAEWSLLYEYSLWQHGDLRSRSIEMKRKRDRDDRLSSIRFAIRKDSLCVVLKVHIMCTSGSVVEYRLAKARVAGSNPVSCFYNWIIFIV